MLSGVWSTSLTEPWKKLIKNLEALNISDSILTFWVLQWLNTVMEKYLCALSIVPLYCLLACPPHRPLYTVAHRISEAVYMQYLHFHSLELYYWSLTISMAKNNAWKSLYPSKTFVIKWKESYAIVSLKLWPDFLIAWVSICGSFLGS